MTDKMKALMFVYERGSVDEKEIPEDILKTLYNLAFNERPPLATRGRSGPIGKESIRYSLMDKGIEEVQKYQEDQDKYRKTNLLVILGILVTLACSLGSCFFGRC